MQLQCLFILTYLHSHQNLTIMYKIKVKELKEYLLNIEDDSMKQLVMYACKDILGGKELSHSITMSVSEQFLYDLGLIESRSK